MATSKKSILDELTKKKKKKLSNFVIDKDSDYPVHEEYVKEKLVKK